MAAQKEPECFGAVLRRFRLAAGLTQEVLAERAQLSVRAIQSLERGVNRTPRRDTLNRLAAALGLSPRRRAILFAAARPGHTPAGADPGAPDIPYPYPLPTSPTKLIGREHEIDRVAALLRRDETRLVTLTGPAGVGKTRLAYEVAEALRDHFDDGVACVPLAALGDPGLVASAIAQVLGVSESGRRPPVETLQEFLRTRRLLLVLDNCEHLLPGAATLLARLVGACRHLKALVTSRARLRVAAEHVYQVPPMTLPDTAAPLAVQRLEESEAVQLFVVRAQAVAPDFTLTSGNAGAVAEICIFLEGLPLAIELAAARVRLFPPSVLMERLSHGALGELTGGPWDAEVRHQRLQDAIAWSYNLLTGDEQRLFRRLGVFAGGCTLDAIEALGPPRTPNAGEEAGGPDDVVAGLASLVDQSLLLSDAEAGGEPRFHMLKTLRDFALDQLERSGEAEVMRHAHAAYFAGLAERAAGAFRGPRQAEWLARLDREHDNFRAILTWTHQEGMAAMGLQLAGALWRFWQIRGYRREGRVWLESLLALTPSDGAGVEASVRAWALLGAGFLAYNQDDYQRARVLLGQSRVLYTTIGDRVGIAACLNSLGLLSLDQGDFKQATILFEQSLDLRRQLADSRGTADCLSNLGLVARQTGRYERAEALFRESLQYREQLGDTRGIATCLFTLGDLALHHGDLGGAAALFSQCLALRREMGALGGIASALSGLGDVAVAEGQPRDALASYQESLTYYQQLDNRLGIAESLERVAHVLEGFGQLEEAARLLGAADQLRDVLGAPRSPEAQVAHVRTVKAIRAVLGAQPFDEAWAAGAALPLGDAIPVALAVRV